jgi:hypothetical protein
MLPQVNAVISTGFQTISSVEDRGGRAPAPIAVPEKAPAGVQQHVQARSEPAVATQRLAGLLGSENIKVSDVLAKLATEFARLIGEQQLPGESNTEFQTRLAAVILSLKPELLQKAEAALGFRAAGFTAYAFAAALKNPASPLAARIVALFESPEDSGLQKALRAAISNYQQNSAGRTDIRPETAAAALKASFDNRADGTQTKGSATVIIAEGDVEPQEDTQAHAAAQGAAKEEVKPRSALSSPDLRNAVALAGKRLAESFGKPEAAATVVQEQSAKPSSGSLVAGQTQSAAKSVVPAALPTGKEMPTTAETSPHMPSSPAERPEGGEHTMQVLRGFSVVVREVAAKADGILQQIAGNELATGSVSATGATTQDKAAKPEIAASANPANAALKESSPDEIAQRARQTVRALEGKVIPLFANAIAGGSVDDSDVERILQRASLSANAAAQAAGDKERTAFVLTPKQPDAVPFAQVPYPPARDEEKQSRRRAFGQESQEGDQDNLPGDEEAAMQDGGDEDAQRPQDEIEEKPFDADEPLARNASEADRAFHMYQRFGGF